MSHTSAKIFGGIVLGGLLGYAAASWGFQVSPKPQTGGAAPQIAAASDPLGPSEDFVIRAELGYKLHSEANPDFFGQQIRDEFVRLVSLGVSERAATELIYASLYMGFERSLPSGEQGLTVEQQMERLTSSEQLVDAMIRRALGRMRFKKPLPDYGPE
jgi:hypothetical protein